MCVRDCRSLYDNLTGVGKLPSEARLALDTEALKELANTKFRWVRARQMIADPLTKATASLFYLYHCLVNREFFYRLDPGYDTKVSTDAGEDHRGSRKILIGVKADRFAEGPQVAESRVSDAG